MRISSFLLLLMLTTTSAQAQQTENAPRERPPVSWVNSKLPEGPSLTHHVLISPALGHEVGYVVYLPPSYATNTTKRFPVVYFLHGMGGNEAADSAGFSGAVRQAVQAGVMPESIVVFPNGGRSGYRGEVEKMIIEELIPMIDRRYRTLADARSRAVAGFSMGGAGAVYLSTKYPNLFSAASSWGGGTGRNQDELFATVEANADTLKKNEFGMIFINGDRDRPEAFVPMAAKLKELGIAHDLGTLPDTGHNLGLYYKLGGERTLRFLGERLQVQN